MAEKLQEELVVGSLEVIGVTSLHEWDALCFLHSHPNSLATTAQVARLIGHDPPQVSAALRKLEGLGLIQRSRAYRGMRFFRIAEPHDPSRRCCLEDLMVLARDRLGRLLVLKHLTRTSQGRRRKRNNGLRFA